MSVEDHVIENRNKEIAELKSELERVKADFDNLLKLNNENIDRIDALRSHADEMAETLEHLAGNCECCPDMISMGKMAAEALASFRAFTKEK